MLVVFFWFCPWLSDTSEVAFFGSRSPTVINWGSRYFFTIAGISSGLTFSISCGYESNSFQEPSRSNHARRSERPSRLFSPLTKDILISFVMRTISLLVGIVVAAFCISSRMIFSTFLGSESFLSSAQISNDPS